MSRKFYSYYAYKCESCSVDCYFEYSNSVIFTSESCDEKAGEQEKFLLVITECEVPDFFGAGEVGRYVRRDNIVIQGIISFFSGIPITIYDRCKCHISMELMEYDKKEVYLKIDDVDFTIDLKILLKKLTDTSDVNATLIDKWRRAIFLKNESEDADLFYDETILNFFQILEILSDNHSDKLKARLRSKIDDALNFYLQYCYMTESQVNQIKNNNIKTIEKILFKDTFNLSAKIKYFLECHNLLDENVSAFVDELVKIRNEIAHGRKTYQEKFIWPLSAFFNLAKDSYEIVEFLTFFTGAMISKYIGINTWLSEWNEIEKFLMPPKNVVQKFLDGQLSQKIVNIISLVDGNEYNITWRTLFNFYVKNPELKIRKKMEVILKEAFLNTNLNDKNSPDIFNISIILADSDDFEVKAKAIDNVKWIISKKWHFYSNYKDAYSYLEFYSVNITWYKNFLNNKDAKNFYP